MKATVITKKVASFFPGKTGSAVPGEGPHIFSEQGPAKSGHAQPELNLVHFSLKI